LIIPIPRTGKQITDPIETIISTGFLNEPKGKIRLGTKLQMVKHKTINFTEEISKIAIPLVNSN
jgi:hypothetical protein